MICFFHTLFCCLLINANLDIFASTAYVFLFKRKLSGYSFVVEYIAIFIESTVFTGSYSVAKVIFRYTYITKVLLQSQRFTTLFHEKVKRF